MYVYICVCINLYIYTYRCVHIYKIHTYISRWNSCMYIYTYLCIFVWLYVYRGYGDSFFQECSIWWRLDPARKNGIYIYLFLYIYNSVYLCIRTYVNARSYTNRHDYILIHIYVHRSILTGWTPFCPQILPYLLWG